MIILYIAYVSWLRQGPVVLCKCKNGLSRHEVLRRSEGKHAFQHVEHLAMRKSEKLAQVFFFRVSAGDCSNKQKISQ